MAEDREEGIGRPVVDGRRGRRHWSLLGWISGQRKALDDVYFLQKYVPRRPRSRWSQINIAKVDELIAAGRMRPSGLAEVEAAKADGRWAAAYGSQSSRR